MVVIGSGGALHLLRLLLDPPWQAGSWIRRAKPPLLRLTSSHRARARPLSASVGKLAEEAVYIVEFACRCRRVLYPLP